jgi:hypothetical protein
MLPNVVRLVSFFALFALACSAARAEEARITVGPAVMTFPKLARKLSIDGRLVTCPPTFRNRAAFVYLKDRPWEEVRTILSSALDVRFKQSEAKPEDWSFGVDPEVAAREAKWQRRAAELMLADIRRSIKDVLSYVNRPYGDFLRRTLDASRAARAAAERDPDAKLPETTRLAEEATRLEWFVDLDEWVAARAVANATVDDVLRCMRTVQQFRPADLRKEVDPATVRAMVADTLERKRKTQEELAGIVDLPFGASDLAEMEARYAGNVRLLHRLVYRPLYQLLEVDCVAYLGTQVTRTTPSGYPDWDDEEPADDSQEDMLKRLSPEAKAWSDAHTRTTEQFLASDLAKRLFRVNDKSHTESLSQVVEAWSSATGHEAVMELSPLREVTALYDYERTDRQTGAVIPPSTATSLAETWKLYSSGDAWLAGIREGVLVVKDGYAFLSRLRPMPLEAFLRLERSIPMSRVANRWWPSPALADIVEYGRTMPAEQGLQLAEAGIYRGVWVDKIAAFGPFALLLSRLTSAEREAIDAGCERPGGYLLPLGELPTATVDELARGLRQIALADVGGSLSLDEACLDSLPTLLRASKLRIEGKVQPRRGISVTLLLPGNAQENSYISPIRLGALRFK